MGKYLGVIIFFVIALGYQECHALPEYSLYKTAEFSYQALGTYQQPPSGIQFGARFTGPDGSTYDVPGFWDGGQTWRVRFAPTLPGKWTYETACVHTESQIITQVFKSDVMRGNEHAQQVDVDVDNAEELLLIVNNGEDDFSHDRADSTDAQLLLKDRFKVYLGDFPPLFASHVHGELSNLTNTCGGSLQISDCVNDCGLRIHSQGKSIYVLNGTQIRFCDWVGVDDAVINNGRASFAVVKNCLNSSHGMIKDSGLDGQKGSFMAIPNDDHNPLYRHGGILRVSQDKHFLTYTDGTPFFWLGDTWWYCPSDLVPIDTSTNPEISSAFGDMIAVRKRQGFTVIHMAFLGTIEGINPFKDKQQRPNLSPAYWQQVDRYMDIANKNGLIPVIGLNWAGRPLSLSLSEWKILWRHLVARYSSHAVTWLMCGEYNKKGTDEIVDRTLALGKFVKQTDPYHRAMTIHPWYHKLDQRQAWDKSWYDFIMFQGGHSSPPSVDMYLKAYYREPTKPILEGECQYEGIRSFSDADVRNVAYRAIQNGSFGYTYGAQGLFYPTQNIDDRRSEKWGKPLVWWKAVRRPGAEQMGILRRIYESVDWWRLQPEPDRIQINNIHGAHVIFDLVEHFQDASSVNAHSPRINDADPNCIVLQPLKNGQTILTYPSFTLPRVAPDESLRLITLVSLKRAANSNKLQNTEGKVQLSIQVNEDSVFELHHVSNRWHKNTVDLTSLAGSQVTLQLAMTSRENINWGYALFHHPVVVKVKKEKVSNDYDTYPSSPSRQVFVKADGQKTFVLYFPADSTAKGQYLGDMPEGSSYTTRWYDPRTGESFNHAIIQVANRALAIPQPPDDHDWVLVLKSYQEG